MAADLFEVYKIRFIKLYKVSIDIFVRFLYSMGNKLPPEKGTKK